MSWFRLIKNASGLTAYHATKENFSQFDLSFAKDELGMQMGEGLGYNKFYFARTPERAFPRLSNDGRPTRLITVQLNISKPYAGSEYKSRLQQSMWPTGRYGKPTLSRQQAVDKLDAELKQQGFDAIDDGWQIAVFNPAAIQIISAQLVNSK